MSSTWSNLGINLQGTGDNSGTWGQLTNVNLQDFDYAISGVAAITLTGNTTLAFTTNSSSTTYTSEAGRAKILVLSGSLSATTVTVTVPNIQKDYAIINNSGATVIISAGGSTTVSIPTSTQAAVYVNGSSSVAFELVNFGNISALLVTATALAFTTATGGTATVTTANITTANVTTANITSLTAVNTTTTYLAYTTATGSTATIFGINATTLNINSGGIIKIYNTATSQYTGLQVAAGAATSQTFTLPSADGTSGQFLKTNGSGVLSFAGANAITWQSVKTTNFTAVAGNGYPVNTTSAAITVTLPVSASTGDTIQIVDYAGTAATNSIIINPNGLKINGLTANVNVTNNNEGLTLTYLDSTQGWKATSAANEGSTAYSSNYSIQFLVVAGGGSGGGGVSGATSGGGGGAGGYRTSTQTVSLGTVITVTVGDGGASVSGTSQGNQGSSSSISGSGLTTITSAGGGGGGGIYTGPGGVGGSGGSGGGGSYGNAGGAGNTPSTSPSQGNNGGVGSTSPNVLGGGGGAGQAGNTNGLGYGGDGAVSSITGSSIYYAGGGGGGNPSPSNGGGNGGGGAGGTGGNGISGTANTGGGGGGGTSGSNTSSGSGGKGVVILSVPTANYSGTSTGSPTVTTSGSNTILKFTGSGSYTS